MQHHGPVWSVVGAGVLDVETLGQVEVELHGRALPFPANRVNELEVELGSVERSAAFVDRELLPTLIHHAREKIFGFLPCFYRTKRLLGWPGGQLDRVRITKGLQHFV